MPLWTGGYTEGEAAPVCSLVRQGELTAGVRGQSPWPAPDQPGPAPFRGLSRLPTIPPQTALALMRDSASAVSLRSVAFSSSRFCLSTAAQSSRPSCLAKAISEP